MPSISSISIFPYSNTNRINGQEFLTNTHGGILTLIVLTIILSVAVTKSMQMFNKTTIVSKVDSQFNFVPPMMNISTTPYDSENIPYMFALKLFDRRSQTNPNLYATAEAAHIEQKGLNAPKTAIKFKFQNCTIDHFWTIPNITQKAVEWNISNWLCLPLNQTYQIGGSTLSSSYKALRFYIYCKGVWCGRSKYYSIGRYVDPTGENPFAYYLNQEYFMATAGISYSFYSKLSVNHLIVDESFLPMPKQSKSSGVQPERNFMSDFLFQSSSYTEIIIEASSKMTTYNRSYMKILDVVSYVSSISSAILAAGLLLAGFNRYYFEMNFARRYFHQKFRKRVGLFNYIKSIFYSVTKNTCLQPSDSEQIEKQKNTRETVNKMLDIVNINKRIVFLEEAINLIFKKHQLKALRLIHPMTKQQADERIDEHKLRPRLVQFIHKQRKRKQQKQKQNQQQKKQSNTITKEVGLSINIQDNYTLSLKQINSSSQFINRQNQFPRLNTSIDFKDQLSPQQKNKGHSPSKTDQKQELRNEQRSDKAEEQNWFNRFGKKIMTFFSQRTSKEMDLEEEAFQNNFYKQQQLREDELKKELSNELRRFVEEAENGSNQFSVQIYAKIEQALKEHLKQLTSPAVQQRQLLINKQSSFKLTLQ